MSVRIIVFSKNRAAQLDLLLRSHREHAKEWDQFSIAVIYKADTADFESGYRRVGQMYPTVQLEPEHARLKPQILSLLASEKRELFHFLADELVFTRPYSVQDRPFALLRARPEIAAVSLRLSPHIDYSQPLSLKTPPPHLDADDTYRWRPRNRWVERFSRLVLRRYPASGDWRLQLNVDGNTFRYEQFKEHLERIPDIPSVNKLESILLAHPMAGDRIAVYPESRLINLAMNRVDQHSSYPCGEHTAEEFNRLFLSGKRLSPRKWASLRHNACHLVTDPEWEDPA